MQDWAIVKTCHCHHHLTYGMGKYEKSTYYLHVPNKFLKLNHVHNDLGIKSSS